MTSRDFAYWLQGFFELSNVQALDSKQVEVIKRHLNLVFAHEIDPSIGGQEIQDKLNQIHSGNGEDSFMIEPYTTPPMPRC